MSEMNENEITGIGLIRKPAGAHLLIIPAVIILTGFLVLFDHPSILMNSAFGQQQQPNIDASNIYQTKTMVLGNDIKNLVILIPNEGHEPQDLSPEEELRVINQPYLPESVVVNVGTTVTWFNADVGHPHSITLIDNSSRNVVYNSGEFEEFTASKPVMLNDSAALSYSGPSFDNMFPDYVMNGTLTVLKQPFSTTLNNTATTANTFNASSTVSSENNIDTVTTLMVPANLVGEISSELQGQGFGIDNQYSFKSLRGGGSAAGDDELQVLLVLTSSGKDLNEVTSALSEVVPAMPYS
jgi:hypothetical protein